MKRMSWSRLLIVSNRLPLVARVVDGDVPRMTLDQKHGHERQVCFIQVALIA
jgi:hypothetical protein